MSDIQARVRALCQAHGVTLAPQPRYIDLASEVGELGKALLVASDYGEKPVSLSPEVRLELGDCLFSLLALADALQIDAVDALDAALAKYEARAAEKGSIGS